jgi:hypothetical protein
MRYIFKGMMSDECRYKGCNREWMVGYISNGNLEWTLREDEPGNPMAAIG